MRKEKEKREERRFWKGSSEGGKGEQKVPLVIGFRFLGQATFDRPQILRACSIRSG